MAHLDVTPSNILLRDGRIVLLDLELARPLGHVRSNGLPNGTEGYQAPEYLGGAPVAPGMDVYAVGIVLAELLVGDDDSESSADSLLPRLDSGCTPAMAAVVTQMVEPHPARRPATAAQAMALLADTDPSERLWPVWADAHLVGTPALGREAGRLGWRGAQASDRPRL
ncbi:MAG: hypothetical protein U0Q21_13115 [Dermatophilaceae bacterium]